MSRFNILSSYFPSAFFYSPSVLIAKSPELRSNSQIRESYNVQISSAYENRFKAKFQEFHDNEQCFGEDLALEAFQVRTEIKKSAQSETSLLARAAIWARNMVMYGGSNATYEGLSKTKNPEEIAYSAFKTDGSNLGLKGNGFGDKLNVWNAIKEHTTLYPEDVSPEMVIEYKSQLFAYQGGKSFKPDVEAIVKLYKNQNSQTIGFDPFPPKKNIVDICV